MERTLADEFIANTVSSGMGNFDIKQQATIKLAGAVALTLIMFLGARRAIAAARADEGTDATALIWLALFVVAVLWLVTSLRQRFGQR